MSMTIGAIDAIIASAVSGNVSYIALKELSGQLFSSSLSDNTGTRLLGENKYRSIDIYEVLKALNLDRTDTKIMILRLLRRWDLIEILYLLDKNQLINGLQFFDKRKLLRLMTSLPKSLLIKMLRHVFSIDEIISKMPTSELFNILRSDKLPNRELIKGFYYMDMKYLLLLISKITGQEVSGLRHHEIMDILFKTKKRQIIEGMKFLPFKALTPMVTLLVKQNPELLEEMSMGFMFRLFESMSKGTLISTFAVVPKDIIIERFLSQLPDQFLLLTAAQIDPNTLEKYLISKHSGILQKLGQDL
ncbi:MAG: hypothetical protein VKJ04_10835 [Vampirovibrionales bacterium]|nr:hypothetical protein [Vampirovibrionales bacterium]